MVGVTWPAFLVDAVTFLASAVIVMGVAPTVGRVDASAEGVRKQGTRGAVVEGLRVVAGARVLWTTLLALAVSMFGLGAVNVLFLPLVVEVLQVNPVWLGAIELAQSVSMILAAGIVALVASRLRPTTIVTVGILAAGVLVGLTGAVTEVWQVVLLLFGIGWFITPLQASVVTIMQTDVPDAARGRVMATLQAAMSGASVASMALAGVFGDVLGIREVFFAAAAIVITRRAAVGRPVSLRDGPGARGRRSGGRVAGAGHAEARHAAGPRGSAGLGGAQLGAGPPLGGLHRQVADDRAPVLAGSRRVHVGLHRRGSGPSRRRSRGPRSPPGGP